MKDSKYIFDDNKIRNCDSNIAKMNVFECFYYFGFNAIKYNIMSLTEYWKEFLSFLFGFIILPILPVLIFFEGFRKIKRAKKEVAKSKILRGAK